jgi:hypothetical protein
MKSSITADVRPFIQERKLERFTECAVGLEFAREHFLPDHLQRKQLYARSDIRVCMR